MTIRPPAALAASVTAPRSDTAMVHSNPWMGRPSTITRRRWSDPTGWPGFSVPVSMWKNSGHPPEVNSHPNTSE